MAPKQTPPFRAEHVGSLLRPGYLLEARRKFERKEVTQEQLREVEDRAIIGAVNMQREVGIKGFTDGEYRSVSRLYS
jgi:methionine synthase II (cobalamin-independent)